MASTRLEIRLDPLADAAFSMAGFWSLLLLFSLLLRQLKTRVTNLSSLAIHNSREEECTHYKHFNEGAHGNKIKILRS
jgi:hypothetical protein